MLAVVVLATAACGSRPAGVRAAVTTRMARFDVPAGTGADVVAETAQVMRRRFDVLGIDGVTINIDGSVLTVEVPDDAGGNHALTVVRRPGDLEIRPVLGTRAAGATLVGAPDREAFLPDLGGTKVYDTGPAAVSGNAVERATAAASNAGSWAVRLVLTPDAIDGLNQIAARCFAGSPECPTKRLAVVVEGVVESAPTVQAERFERDQLQISAGFTLREAQDLAAVLEGGALPVPVTRSDG